MHMKHVRYLQKYIKKGLCDSLFENTRNPSLPIIITRPIGPQERCNRMWLIEKGAGIDFCNDSDINKWISYLLNSGKLAEAAFNGFMNGRKYGTFNIIDFLEKGSLVSGNDPFSR